MPKTLSYADAVRILGQGPELDVVRRIDDATGGILLGATVTTPAVLGWFDALARFADLSHQVATAVGRRLTGAHRLDRTDRIAAAHTIVVIAAYFEALAGTRLPFELSKLRLTSEDQWRLAGTRPQAERVAQAALHATVGLPEPHGFREEYLKSLRGTYYRDLSRAVIAFLRGLSVWDELSTGEADRAERALAEVPAGAVARYERLLLDLQADCPEVALWVRDRDHRAVLSALHDLGGLMRQVAVTVTAAHLPHLLGRAYGALLDRPVADSGDLPAGLEVPSLRQAYVPALFRILEASVDNPAGDERTWTDRPVRSDLHPFLTGFLTSPRARQAPLLVLGQPGAGKSVLTRVLAAELSEGGFLPIRVPLRDVDTSLDLQRQIEQAVGSSTTEPVSWPRVAEAAGGRLPVVLLDGFDELLQATATSQTDYLHRVADFQQRERDLGRAVAFVVTTRTSVADRAAPPPETLALRLEPFDTERITRWLDVWHGVNAGLLGSRGLRPLPAEVALRFPELAGQPLLLLLLALYDADENALQHTGTLSEVELYERLLTSFARREVRKAAPHLAEEQCAREVELELRRLSVVAFAMLNRSAQWVGERDLEADLTAIFGRPPEGTVGDGIGPATLLLGRFFFVHRAQAVRGRATLQTYEFLHATFGEYLVARFTWQLLGEAVARASVTVSAGWSADDGLLSRLLSFAPLAGRAPIIRFCREMAERLPVAGREAWATVTTTLYRRSQDVTWAVQAGDYRPATLPMPARYAVYTANLVLLAVLVSGDLRFGALAELDGHDAGHRWHDQALLWHSQLSSAGWHAMVEHVAATPCRDDSGARDVRLRLVDGSAPVPVPDPVWLYDRPEDQRSEFAFADVMAARDYRRLIQFSLCAADSTLLHALTPVLESALNPSVRTYCRGVSDECPSAAEALLRVWLLPALDADPDTVHRAYLACAQIAAYRFPPWDERAQQEYARQLIRALESDTVPVETAAEVITTLVQSDALDIRLLVPSILRAAGRALPRGTGEPGAALRLAETCLWLQEAYGRFAIGPGDEPNLHAVLVALRPAHPRPAAVPRPDDPAPEESDGVSIAGVHRRLAGLLPQLEEAYRHAEILEAALAAVSAELRDVAGESDFLAAAVDAVSSARVLPDRVAAVLAYVAHRVERWGAAQNPLPPEGC
ncbi:NACHT domain-containing protein [Couchioplanes azureus]|uniref:NACHT domain-containing protein n=1 Tax=Couchioplanes caeruleus TaxID=56438 RepID=UPI00166FE9E2|nr:hypothetical protein [Couchioplanes caeruleus]GGQ48980.1 hypothetical protein GCM10010166_16650 [Couchioplanes caeruleus subsp. azureus]